MNYALTLIIAKVKMTTWKAKYNDLAEKYKSSIDIHVYEALMNWKVEITD